MAESGDTRLFRDLGSGFINSLSRKPRGTQVHALRTCRLGVVRREYCLPVFFVVRLSQITCRYLSRRGPDSHIFTLNDEAGDVLDAGDGSRYLETVQRGYDA